MEDNRVSATSENTVSATITALRPGGGACKKQTVAKDRLFLILLCNAKIGVCSRCVLDYWIDVTHPRRYGKDRWWRAAPECVVVLQRCFSCCVVIKTHYESDENQTFNTLRWLVLTVSGLKRVFLK